MVSESGQGRQLDGVDVFGNFDFIQIRLMLFNEIFIDLQVACTTYATLVGYHYNHQDNIVSSVNQTCSNRLFFNTFYQPEDSYSIEMWMTFVLSSAACSLFAALIATCSIMCNVVWPMRLWFLLNPISMMMNSAVVLFVSSLFLFFLSIQAIFYVWTFTWHKSVGSKPLKYSTPEGLDSISSQHI